MGIKKVNNGWHYTEDEPSKAWYKIQVTPLNEEQEPFVFKVETHDIDWTMEQYPREHRRTSSIYWEQYVLHYATC